MLDFLRTIDWRNHDGVNLNMLNDFVRNQFYDKAIADNVKGKCCLDVGFGTGFLSILALQHGASSVIAYENDDNRYLLGKEIIQRLGLGKKIELIHDRYDYSLISEHPEVEVLVTETVNGNLWWEGMFNNIPAEPSNVVYVPGQYFLNFYAIPVGDQFAQGIVSAFTGEVNEIYPGVDIDIDWLNCVNDLMAMTDEREYVPRDRINLDPDIWPVDNKNNSPWGWIAHMRLVHDQQPWASYALDVARAEIITTISGHETTKPFDFRASRVSMSLDTSQWQNCNILLVPRVGLRSGMHSMFLDLGHWGPAENPVLLIKPQQNLTITHSLRSGSIKYTYQS